MTAAMQGMKVLRLPNGGRAALSFPVVATGGRADWGKTQGNALFGATRANVLKEWGNLPQFLRRDPGFECMMDYYSPMTEEGFKIKQQLHKMKLREQLKELLGSKGDVRELRGSEYDLDTIMGKMAKDFRACVDFGVPFGGTSTIVTNSTSHTVAGTKARANQAVRLWGFDIGFDGTTSTNGPGIVEIQQDTFATNPPGTNSVSVTGVVIDFARPETVQSTAAKAWTTEPTAITTAEVFFIPNYMGSGIIFTPLTKPFAMAGATGPSGASMRVTQQSGIVGNATGALKHEE